MNRFYSRDFAKIGRIQKSEKKKKAMDIHNRNISHRTRECDGPKKNRQKLTKNNSRCFVGVNNHRGRVLNTSKVPIFQKKKKKKVKLFFYSLWET